MFLNVEFVEMDRVYVKFVEGQKKTGTIPQLLPIFIYEKKKNEPFYIFVRDLHLYFQ